MQYSHKNNLSVVVQCLKSSRKLLVTGVAAALPLFETPDALAQSESRSASYEIEEILVVARRVEESQQNVPLAITTLSGELIERQSITTATDLTGLVPTLSVQRGGLGASPNFAIRGIRSGVASYFAEIPTNNATIDAQLWDLASVQAIAGPQGTLFGKNSTGGAILFVPESPTDEFEAYVKGSLGNYDYREIETVANLPINDNLKIRLGAQIRDRDGFVDNISGPDLHDANREAYRLSATWTPADGVKNDTVLAYSELNEKQVVQINQTGAVSDTITSNPFGSQLAFAYSFLYGPTGYADALAAQRQRGERSADLPYPHFEKEHRFNLSNILTVDFNAFSLRHITGYAESGGETFTSSSSFALPIVLGGTLIKDEELTQEVQVIGNAFDGFMDYQVGGYYSHHKQPYADSTFITFGPPGLVVNLPINPLTATTVNTKLDETSKAVYGQITLHPSTELSVTAGVRYTRDTIEDVNTSTSPGGVCTLRDIPTADLVNCVQRLEDDFSATTYNLSADYRLSDDVLIYAATRRGYNAGGHNINISGEENITYDPEIITDFEVGLKGDWSLGGIPLRSNIAGFYSNYEDIQRRVVVVEPIRQAVTINAAEATLYGAQFDLSALITPNFNMHVNYGYLHSEYDKFVNPLVGDATGNKFAQAPEHTASLSGTYSIDLEEGALVVSANYQYISAQLSDDNNVDYPEAEIPGYGIWGARIDWQNVSGTGVDLAIFGKNLGDKLYQYNISVAPSLATVTHIYGEPRTYGLEMKYSF